MFDKIKKFLKPSSSNGSTCDFASIFENFQDILKGNNRALELFAELEDMMSGEYIYDINYLRSACADMSQVVHKIIYSLNMLSGNRYTALFNRYEAIRLDLQNILDGKQMILPDSNIVDYCRSCRYQDEIIGSKNANLCEIMNALGLRIPEGFAITISAYFSFLEKNELLPKIAEIMQSDVLDCDKDKAIALLFGKAILPEDVKKSILKKLSALSKKLGKKARFALRSSACGEDNKGTTFAGQFLSMLNLNKDEVIPAYKKIVESRFLTSVLSYEDNGEKEDMIPMSVACQQMIAAKASGVVYTADPTSSHLSGLIISSVYGLGAPAVSGEVDADQYIVSRLHPFPVRKSKIANKKTMLIASNVSGGEVRDVPPDLREKPCLSENQVQKLAELAMEIDLHFKCPQDIEWAMDRDGEFVILQVRPLSLCTQTARMSERVKVDYPVVFKNIGQIVQRGIAVGKVHVVSDEDNPDAFPLGSIAVTKYATPRLSRIIKKAAAIITDVGSSTGHLATVAREFGVPAIFGTSEATSLLKTGMEVSVDCEENVVYQGIIEEFIQYQIEGQERYTDLTEYRMLRNILGKVTPLNLFDPTSNEFKVKGCKSYHDILRFCHEKAVCELLDFHTQQKNLRKLKSRQMKLSIPLGLDVIDMGKGLSANIPDCEIESIDQVLSIPMKAILHGLTLRGVWDTNPKSLQFSDFMSSMTRFSLDDSSEFTGRNLAVITENYINLNLRLGYHFTVVDSYLSENMNDNYIYFRFVGGVTETERRKRRAVLLKNILEKYDFKVVVKNDLVVGKIKKRELQDMQEILTMLGKLIGFTRQLDTQMVSDGSIERYLKRFEELTHI